MSLNRTDIEIFTVLKTHCYVNRQLFNYSIANRINKYEMRAHLMPQGMLCNQGNGTWRS